MGQILINLDNVGVTLAGNVIFQSLSWEIQAGQRIGLVGPNGAGKSTLLKLIAQELPLEGGNLFRAQGLTWGRLEQEPVLPAGRTVFEETMTALPELIAVEARLRALEQRMGDPAVYSSETELARVMRQHERALHAYEKLGGPRFESDVKQTLTQLGFGPDTWDRPVDVLSGGQKKLIMLGKHALRRPQLLMLDEPDNHLDLAAKRRLESFVNGYEGSIVIISHDRYLLDEIATHIAELEGGRLNLYTGNYSAYTTERALRRLRQQQMYAAQQKEIARIEAAIARFELWASIVVDERHIKQARSRRKMLDKMDKVEKVVTQRKMALDLAGWRGSKKVIQLIDVGKAFDNGHILWAGLNATIWHNERVGLVGPNGAGKSMLLKQLLDPDAVPEGEIRLGPSTTVGYYAQEHETLDYDETLLETIRKAAPMREETVVAFLNRFLFSYDQVRGRVGDLSGGERSRLQLARLVLSRPNLLLLDEPTNNLDITSIEVLEETLDEFVGTVVVISHDRFFLDRVVDRVVELRDGELTEFDGGYTDYLIERGDLLAE